MGNGQYLWLGALIITLTCLTHDTRTASIQNTHRSTNEQNIERTSTLVPNKTDIRIISNQIISDELTTVPSLDQVAEESQRGTVKYTTPPSEVTKTTTESSDEDRNEYGRFFDVDKYVSPEFHNINNVFNSETAEFVSSELGELTTPRTRSFDDRHQQIQDEINANMKYYDSFTTTSQRPKFSLKEHGINKQNIDYQNQANVQVTDSTNSGSRHIGRVAENRTQLHTQNAYYVTSDDNPAKENELDYPQLTTQKPRTRFSLRNNTSEEKTIILKKPTVKWKPFYLSTQVPTSIDPVFSIETAENSVVSEQAITLAKRGSTKFVDTVSTLDDGQNFTIPASATAWSLTSLTNVTPKNRNGSDDSVIEENQLFSVRVLAPNSTSESPIDDDKEAEAAATTTAATNEEEQTTISSVETTTTMSAEMFTESNIETTTQFLEPSDITGLYIEPTTYKPSLEHSTYKLPRKRKPVTTTEYYDETTTTISPEITTLEETSTIFTSSTEVTTPMSSTEKEYITTTDSSEIISTSEVYRQSSIERERIITTGQYSSSDISSKQYPSTESERITTTGQYSSSDISDKQYFSTESSKLQSSTEGQYSEKTTETSLVPEITTTEDSVTETLPLFSPTVQPELLPVTDVPTEMTTESSSTTQQIKLSSSTTSTIQTPILTVVENASNSIEKKLSTTEIPPTIQDITIKTGKTNDLSTSDEDFDIRIKVDPTSTTKPTSWETPGYNDKTIDNKLTDTNLETSSEIKISKTSTIYKQPSTESTPIPLHDMKFGHKTIENDVNKRPSTTPDEGTKYSISEEENRKSTTSTEPTTTTESEFETMPFDRDDNNSMAIVVAVIVCIAVICLILVAVLLIIMRKRQKRFNYGQRCTPVSLDAYSLDSVSVYNSVRRKAIRASKRSYGNPGFEDPDNISHPLNFPALANFANNAQEIAQEYDEIPVITAQASEVPPGCESKNRYANVVPLPETRVYLQKVEGDVHSDYINANFVRGPKNSKAYYIATQAPLENTIDDFWRMIWEQQCKLIIMLTDLYENGVEKCFDYLPPSEVLDCNRQFGDFQITLKKREVKDKYITHTIQLKNMVSNCWREVTHIWYLGWPERGTPNEVDSLIALLIEARSYTKSQNNNTTEDEKMMGPESTGHVPILVHCSPGTGRTGAVIACDILMREFELTRLVDIPKLIYRIRRDRAGAVQTRDQYAYIYKMINAYATKLTGGALDSI